MKHWSRNDRFAFFGVLLTAIGVIGAIFPQEIRHIIGLDNGTPPAQSATLPASGPPAPSQPDPVPPAPVTSSKVPAPSAPAQGVPKELEISVTGDANTVTILPAPTADDATIDPVPLRGDNQAPTYYLRKGEHAVVEGAGDGNVVLLDPGVKTRVQVTITGDGNKTDPYTGK